METLSSAKQEGMVDVNLRSGNANSSHSQEIEVATLSCAEIITISLFDPLEQLHSDFQELRTTFKKEVDKRIKMWICQLT